MQPGKHPGARLKRHGFVAGDLPRLFRQYDARRQRPTNCIGIIQGLSRAIYGYIGIMDKKMKFLFRV